MTLDTTTYVGTYEIGQLLGVQPMTVHMWRRREYLNFPVPAFILRIGPVWTQAEVMEWAKDHDRL